MTASTLLANTEGSSSESNTAMETIRGPLNSPLLSGDQTKKRKSRWGERVVDSASNADVNEPGTVASVVHEDELSLKRYKKFRRGRSSSTCRNNRPTFQQKHHAEWRCIVCYLWNSQGRPACSRCGAVEGVDQFGTSVRRSAPPARCGVDNQHNHRHQEEEFQWPNKFETNGCDYVFDPRSNMFYDQVSDFFYDCNSKLYYSNKEKTYFRRVENPVGCVFVKVSGASETPTTADSTSSRPSKAPAALASEPHKAKKIEIRIRSKSLSVSRPRRSPSRGKSVNDEPLDKRRKEQLEHVEKWNKLSLTSALSTPSSTDHANAFISRVRTVASIDRSVTNTQEFLDMAERTSQANVGTMQVHPSEPATLTSPSPTTLKKMLPPTVATNSGQPICILCKRKFASLDQLKRHEQQSELHKSNLMKKKIEEMAAPILLQQQQYFEKAKYEDRAKKRRLLHGDLPVAMPTKRIELSRSAVERSAVINPENALDRTVGKQLFQKMLAKSSPFVPKDTPAVTRLCETIKDDWKRIESMSSTRAMGGYPQNNAKGLGF